MTSKRMPFEQYQLIDAVNVSTLLELLQSPKHYRYRKRHPPRETKAMKVGKAAHTAVLEPMQFLREYVLEPDEFADAKGNVKSVDKARNMSSYKAWCAAQTKTILTRQQYEAAERMQDAVRSHPVACTLLDHGEREATITWDDAETGLPCKGRIDWLNGAVQDLKTTRHASPFAFAKDSAQRHYHTRLAWYVDGVHAARGGKGLPPAAWIIAVQNEEPHDVVVYRVPEGALEAGRHHYRRLMSMLAECIADDRWPGVSEDQSLVLELPDWA
jgi:exodeoxyribonuclease VIII